MSSSPTTVPDGSPGGEDGAALLPAAPRGELSAPSWLLAGVEHEEAAEPHILRGID